MRENLKLSLCLQKSLYLSVSSLVFLYKSHCTLPFSVGEITMSTLKELKRVKNSYVSMFPCLVFGFII